MIQPLRTVHRWIFIALAVILIVIFIAAIRAQRAPIPNNPGKRNMGSAPQIHQPADAQAGIERQS